MRFSDLTPGQLFLASGGWAAQRLGMSCRSPLVKINATAARMQSNSELMYPPAGTPVTSVPTTCVDCAGRGYVLASENVFGETVTHVRVCAACRILGSGELAAAIARADGIVCSQQDPYQVGIQDDPVPQPPSLRRATLTFSERQALQRARAAEQAAQASPAYTPAMIAAIEAARVESAERQAADRLAAVYPSRVVIQPVATRPSYPEIVSRTVPYATFFQPLLRELRTASRSEQSAVYRELRRQLERLIDRVRSRLQDESSLALGDVEAMLNTLTDPATDAPAAPTGEPPDPPRIARRTRRLDF